MRFPDAGDASSTKFLEKTQGEPGSNKALACVWFAHSVSCASLRSIATRWASRFDPAIGFSPVGPFDVATVSDGEVHRSAGVHPARVTDTASHW